MPKLIYRVVSACGALGYGFPKESLEAALKGRDVFGAQQQAAIECLNIPIHAAALARASSF